VAVAKVQPPGPIQFGLRRNSPGVSRLPRTPCSSSAWISEIKRVETGSVSSRLRPWLIDGALGALNLAGEHRLLAHVHEHKQIRVWQRFHRPIQPAQGSIGLGEKHLQFAAQPQRWIRWQRRRMESPEARGLAAVGTGAARSGFKHGLPCLSHQRCSAP
jgi:hypothetical protein